MSDEPTAAHPLAAAATDVAPRDKPSSYPEPFAARMTKREKRALGDVFGLSNFGVNLTRLAPGGESALLHRHTKQDEFVYILDGTPTLVTDAGDIECSAECAQDFPAKDAHQLVNRARPTSSISKSATALAATKAPTPRRPEGSPRRRWPVDLYPQGRHAFLTGSRG